MFAVYNSIFPRKGNGNYDVQKHCATARKKIKRSNCIVNIL